MEGHEVKPLHGMDNKERRPTSEYEPQTMVKFRIWPLTETNLRTGSLTQCGKVFPGWGQGITPFYLWQQKHRQECTF